MLTVHQHTVAFISVLLASSNLWVGFLFWTCAGPGSREGLKNTFNKMSRSIYTDKFTRMWLHISTFNIIKWPVFWHFLISKVKYLLITSHFKQINILKFSKVIIFLSTYYFKNIEVFPPQFMYICKIKWKFSQLVSSINIYWKDAHNSLFFQLSSLGGLWIFCQCICIK